LHRYNNSDISNELNLAKITNVHSYCGAVTTVTASQKILMMLTTTPAKLA